MVSEAPLSNDDKVVEEKQVTRSTPKKKNTGKVPKKIHKAEREKQKRDDLNVLFLKLGNSLESAQPNSGKASILSDTARLLRGLLAQICSLRKENAALLSESHYVTVENNELREENFAMGAQIEKLQNELEERNRSRPAWNLDFSQSQQNNTAHQLLEDPSILHVVDHSSQPEPVLGPLLVVPLHHDLQVYPNSGAAEVTSKIPTNVSKPHARYPSPSDAWPSQILTQQPKITQQPQLSGSTSASSSTSSRED